MRTFLLCLWLAAIPASAVLHQTGTSRAGGGMSAVSNALQAQPDLSRIPALQASAQGLSLESAMTGAALTIAAGQPSTVQPSDQEARPHTALQAAETVLAPLKPHAGILDYAPKAPLSKEQKSDRLDQVAMVLIGPIFMAMGVLLASNCIKEGIEIASPCYFFVGVGLILLVLSHFLNDKPSAVIEDWKPKK